MAPDNIEQLLAKFDQGETTLEEEKELKAFFSQNSTPAHLEQYKLMFEVFSSLQKEECSKKMELPNNKRNTRKLIASVVIIILIVGTWVTLEDSKKALSDLSEEDLNTYNQTKSAMMLLSLNVNKGIECIKTLELVSTQMESSSQKFNYLNQFSETKNKIFKKN